MTKHGTGGNVIRWSQREQDKLPQIVTDSEEAECIQKQIQILYMSISISIFVENK